MTVNLELQLKFLNELNDALADALGRYHDEGPEKLAELKYMQQEVARARRVIAERMDGDDNRASSRSRIRSDDFQEAAYS